MSWVCGRSRPMAARTTITRSVEGGRRIRVGGIAPEPLLVADARRVDGRLDVVRREGEGVGHRGEELLHVVAVLPTGILQRPVDIVAIAPHAVAGRPAVEEVGEVVVQRARIALPVGGGQGRTAGGQQDRRLLGRALRRVERSEDHGRHVGRHRGGGGIGAAGSPIRAAAAPGHQQAGDQRPGHRPSRRSSHWPPAPVSPGHFRTTRLGPGGRQGPTRTDPPPGRRAG